MVDAITHIWVIWYVGLIMIWPTHWLIPLSRLNLHFTCTYIFAHWWNRLDLIQSHACSSLTSAPIPLLLYKTACFHESFGMLLCLFFFYLFYMFLVLAFYSILVVRGQALHASGSSLLMSLGGSPGHGGLHSALYLCHPEHLHHSHHTLWTFPFAAHLIPSRYWSEL